MISLCWRSNFFHYFYPHFSSSCSIRSKNKYQSVLYIAHMCSLFISPFQWITHEYCGCALFTVPASQLYSGTGWVLFDCAFIAFVMCILVRLTDGQRAKNEIYYQSFICCSSYKVRVKSIRTRVLNTHTHTNSFNHSTDEHFSNAVC